MKITPLDIRHKEFRRAVRGYSDEEVDIFLDEVADAFERFFQENIDLLERVRHLEEQVGQYEGLKEALQKTLVSAQQQADDTRTNARKEAELILRDAELKSRGITNEAYAEKARVQQALIQVRQVEEDFRFKFRSLLEAHLNLLAEDESSEERRRFRSMVVGVEEELDEPTEGEAQAVLGSPTGSFQVAAAGAAAAAPGALHTADNGDSPTASTGPVFRPAFQDPFARFAQPVEEPVEEPFLAPAASVGQPAHPDSEARDPFDQVYSYEAGDPEEVSVDSPDSEGEPPRRESSVRRFLFGKRDDRQDGDLFEESGRDFEW